MISGSASGIFSLTWLVIALPLAGAAILLLGGRYTDRWGHLLGVALPIGSFVLSVLMFVELTGRGEDERQVAQHRLHVVRFGRSVRVERSELERFIAAQRELADAG